MGFLSSTVGRKILMAITGLMLVGFLCVHLLGNSFIYFGWINIYGEKLHSMPAFVWAFRMFMLLVFAVHIYFGITLTLENNAARPQQYAVKKELRANIAGKTMIWTGLLVAAFVVYHVISFSQVSQFGFDIEGRHDVFKMIVTSFSNILIAGAYIVALAALLLHLFHGIQSFIQTFGLNSDCSIPVIEKSGRGIAIIMFLGYVSIPVVILLGILAYKG